VPNAAMRQAPASLDCHLCARAIDDGSRIVRFCLSDGSVDRMGDRIAVNGWELGAYRKNPTVLWAHDSSAPPIGRMVRDFVTNEKLMGDVQFASADVYPFADTIYRLVTEGFIKAGSVGFLPICRRQVSSHGNRLSAPGAARVQYRPSAGQCQRAH
jgi:hypothetical protein